MGSEMCIRDRVRLEWCGRQTCLAGQLIRVGRPGRLSYLVSGQDQDDEDIKKVKINTITSGRRTPKQELKPVTSANCADFISPLANFPTRAVLKTIVSLPPFLTATLTSSVTVKRLVTLKCVSCT